MTDDHLGLEASSELAGNENRAKLLADVIVVYFYESNGRHGSCAAIAYQDHLCVPCVPRRQCVPQDKALGVNISLVMVSSADLAGTSMKVDGVGHPMINETFRKYQQDNVLHLVR